MHQKWNSIPAGDKRKTIGIRTQKQVDTIDYAINEDNIKSMIALIEYDGIGLKTMQNCFRVVMNYQYHPTLNL